MADGITISGGEPFDQFDALIRMLQGLRRLSQVDILVYSGNSLEHIDDQLRQASGLIDALINDPYDEVISQTMALRGSDNPRLNCLPPWVGRA